ncbi:MAG: hypothetical protein IPK22_24095 [Verrucomicrobiaceae bacterium]|nr:hypothetical protein [Verrucomicrobiaceae bacterium]
MRLFVTFLIFSTLCRGVAFGDVYTDAGCKPVDQVWEASDYLVFASLFQSGKVPLPRSGESDDDKLLSRLCSEENLHFCTNNKVSLEVRLGELKGILMALAFFQKHILDTTDKRQRVGREFAMVSAFVIRVQSRSIRLSKEHESEAEHEMKNWITNFCRACGTMMARTQKILETDVFTSPEDCSLLLSAVAASSPDFVPTMSRDQRRDSAKAFQALRAKFPSTHDVKAIDEIVSALELE